MSNWDKSSFIEHMRDNCSREIAKIGDEEGYPSDVFVPMDDLFHTQSQVDKFIKTMEGATYRLKQ